MCFFIYINAIFYIIVIFFYVYTKKYYFPRRVIILCKCPLFVVVRLANFLVAREEAYQDLYFTVLQNYPKIPSFLIMIDNKIPLEKTCNYSLVSLEIWCSLGKRFKSKSYTCISSGDDQFGVYEKRDVIPTKRKT